MAVIECHSCSTWLSISALPGGNPTAKNDPHFAASWRMCGSCEAYLCNTCAPHSQRTCPKCAGEFLPPNKLTPSAFQRWFGFAPTEQFAHAIGQAGEVEVQTTAPTWREHVAPTLGLKFSLPINWKMRTLDTGKPIFRNPESDATLTITNVWVSGRNLPYTLSEHISTSVERFCKSNSAMQIAQPPRELKLGDISAAIVEFEGIPGVEDQSMRVSMLCVCNIVREPDTGLPVGVALFDIFLWVPMQEFAKQEEHYRSLLEHIGLTPLRGRLNEKTQKMVVQIDAHALAASRADALQQAKDNANNGNQYDNSPPDVIAAIASMASAQKWFAASCLPPFLLTTILEPGSIPIQVSCAMIATVALYKGARHFMPWLSWIVTLPLMLLPLLNLVTPIVWIVLLQQKKRRLQSPGI